MSQELPKQQFTCAQPSVESCTLPKGTVVSVQPGTTVYMETEVDAPGQWAFHCHLSYHAAAGMFRKVIVEGGPESTQAKTDVIAKDGGGV